jgi:hypothetical protein
VASYEAERINDTLAVVRNGRQAIVVHYMGLDAFERATKLAEMLNNKSEEKNGIKRKDNT